MGEVKEKTRAAWEGRAGSCRRDEEGRVKRGAGKGEEPERGRREQKECKGGEGRVRSS